METSTGVAQRDSFVAQQRKVQMIDSHDLAEIERRLRVAFVARYGIGVAEDLTQECLTWGWANREQLAEMKNPVGYLFRVGQSRSRRLLRWQREKIELPPEIATEQSTWTEPALPAALAALNDQQRTMVMLTHCFEWTYAEVADLLEVPQHTVRNGVHRGLKNLRNALGTETI